MGKAYLKEDEKEILKIFAKYNPFSLDEIDYAYRKLGSYDKVDIAMKMAISVNERLSNMVMLIL